MIIIHLFYHYREVKDRDEMMEFLRSEIRYNNDSYLYIPLSTCTGTIVHIFSLSLSFLLTDILIFRIKSGKAHSSYNEV